ncbi:MAG: hypothetical protein HFH32_10215 [Eubacterium sp.]|nr:hypothetical protein [Eubacterium sp.]
MTEQELKRDYDMFTNAWRFFKKYAVVEDKDNDKFWEQVVDESSEISKQYGECKLIINLVLAGITELERLYKEKKAADEGVQNAKSHAQGNINKKE